MVKQISFFMFFSLIITCLNNNAMDSSSGPKAFARRTVMPVQEKQVKSEVILTKDSQVSLLNGTKIIPKKDTVPNPIGFGRKINTNEDIQRILSSEKGFSLFSSFKQII